MIQTCACHACLQLPEERRRVYVVSDNPVANALKSTVHAAWKCPTCGGEGHHFLGCKEPPAASPTARPEPETER